MNISPIILDNAACFSLFQRQGLVFIGMTKLARDDVNYGYFARWIEQGMHAQMTYMQKHLDVRRDPSKIMDRAASALTFALPYGQFSPLSPAPSPLPSSPPPLIARYARIKDYHHLLHQRATTLLPALNDLIGGAFDYRIFVDTAPLYERSLAERSGTGFVGKNRCYIHPQWGSFVVLGTIVTTADVIIGDGSQPPKTAKCGRCQRCIDHCPTAALDATNGLDARRCMAYWTIEHRGPIPESLWVNMKSYWFGCDLCQTSCPHNNHKVEANYLQKGLAMEGAIGSPHPVSPQSEALTAPQDMQVKDIDLYEVALMDQRRYELWFGGTAMTRAKIHGLKRNALIALHVTGDPRLPALLDKIKDEDHPVIKSTIQAIMRRLATNGLS